jgi:4-carboxymuconolactone decarboxylase
VLIAPEAIRRERRDEESDADSGAPPAMRPAAASHSKGAELMANEPTAARNPYADIAPALGEYTNEVLFGDVWKRPGLSPRDRSLVTVAALVALYRTNELPFHLAKALENGVTKDELIELITHLAFYSGWPTANSAVTVARKVFEEAGR